MRRRHARRTVAGFLITAVLLAAALPVAAQEPLDPGDDGGNPSVRLVVAHMDSVVGAGAVADEAEPREDVEMRLLVENDGEVPAERVRVYAQVYGPPPEGARSNLHAALDDEDLDQFRRLTLAEAVVGDGDIAPGAVAGVELTIPGNQIGWGQADAVHPIKLSVNLGPDTHDEFVTAVVYLANQPVQPLHTTVVLPLETEHGRSAAGTYESSEPEDLRVGGRLDTLLTLGEQLGHRPLTLAPDVATAEELSDRADGFTLDNGTEVTADDPSAERAEDLLERMRAAVQGAAAPPVVGPYADVDVAALASGPERVAHLAETAVEMERSRTQSLLGRSPDRSTYLSTVPLTPQLVDWLPAERVLLPHSDIRADSGEETRSHRVVEGRDGRQLEAVVADPHITSILANPPEDHGSVVARQRLLAETAMLWQASPSVPRTLLVLPPSGWNPEPTTARPMLTAVLDAPWVTMEPIAEDPVGELAGRCPVARLRSVCVDLATAATSLPAAVSGHLIEGLGLIDALRAAVPADTEVLGDRSLADLEDALLRAVTPVAREAGGENAVAQIIAVKEVVDSAFGTVDIVEGPPITLTSTTGNIPVTISRDGGGPINVMIEVVESSARLVWDEGGQREDVELTGGAVQTVSFAARAVGRGTFPVKVSVHDPTGNKLLDTATLSVTSTAISQPALIVVGVIVALLLLAGVRRRRRPRLEVVS